ncbi:cupin domain-containing protein [Mycobacterium sp. Y57]|uniref:cupin domain-containing protein n=1 Tax=Mycolicibacterium xanthum TaxID=2796469 RepID=UPI001C85B64A|nr:cupin domain-containing protein [Mycolicibacterium xanthum]MBX7430513.1 cupin domain-containing protein [Mycolicibacterium xanthum]
MSAIPELPKLPDDEKVIPDFVGSIDPADLSSLVFPLAKFQQFDEKMPTVVLGYVTGQIGMVVWNLAPGQQNDYHVHPTTEHLHIIIEGECEYTLGDEPPFITRVGDAVMVPPGIPHGIRNTGDKRASYVAVTSPGPYEKIHVDRAEGQSRA